MQETVSAITQLDSSLGSLRSWLGDAEIDLYAPVQYDTCTEREIKRKLAAQQVSCMKSRTATLGSGNTFPAWQNILFCLSLLNVYLISYDLCVRLTERWMVSSYF